MVVEVWTSDDQRFLYEITEVRRHQRPARRRAPVGDGRGALAPDVGGPEGHARQDPGRQAPGRRHAALATGRSTPDAHPKAQLGRLRAPAAGPSDPVDPAQDDRRGAATATVAR